MTNNTYGVAKSAWTQWTEDQQEIFNRVYEDVLRSGPSLFLHPDTIARKLSEDEFLTIAWNAAWMAADCVNDDRVTTIKTIDKDGDVISVDHLPEIAS